MPLYAFLDESGEFVFSNLSGRFLVFAGVVTGNPMLLTGELSELRSELLAQGLSIERFHASEDSQAVRDKVYALISTTDGYAVHSIVVRKNRVNPSLYRYGVYSVAYKTLLKYLTGTRRRDELHIVVDTVPDRSQAAVLKNTLQKRADEVLAPRGIQYSISHHASSAHVLLQVADYCAWAIYKKWNAGDRRAYETISTRIHNEYDIFANGDRDYY